MKNIVIFGATSGIARAVLRAYSKDQNRIVLVARDSAKLDILKKDFETRGEDVEIKTITHDFFDTEGHTKVIEATLAILSSIDIALIAYGTLPDQLECEKSEQALFDNIALNLTSPALLLNVLAQKMEELKKGTIAVITSVAGDRGRKSNYAYGAAKAGLSTFVDGMRGRLLASGVHVLNIKPGFVSTPMTSHLPQGPLFAQPDAVAKHIKKAIEKQKNTIYTPFFWRFIMMIIKSIPEFIFKKLSI